MNLGKVQYFEKVESPTQKDFLCAHNNCALCGENLELRHVRVAESPEIKEEAYCANCDVRTRAKVFSVN